MDRKLRDIFKQEKPQLKDNQIPLDEALRVLLDRLHLSAQPDLLGKPQLLQDLRIALDNGANGMRCVACSQFRPVVCNGSNKDDVIVSAGGACLAPLREMFEIAHHTARHYYTTVGTIMPGNPDVFLATEPWPGKPHDFPVDYYVNGLTSYVDSPGKTQARVSLIIPAELFDTATYLSTLSVLFHECIVHAFHALNPPVIRVGPKPEDRFIEGWMDWISHQVLVEVLGGTGQVGQPSFGFLNLRRAHAEDFHNARIRYWDSAPAALARERYTGRSVAEKVLNVLKSRRDLSADPWHKFLQMSFDLNMMSNFDHNQRQIFVRVLDFLDDDRQDNASPRHQILSGIISNYLRHNNLSDFVDQILRLKPQWLSRTIKLRLTNEY
ncbi:MAG: hypothetical protein WAM70_08930 [Pyrinomonadaceae bacterium]